MNSEIYKDQIVSAIKEHMPDSGPAPEKNLSALISNRGYRDDIKATGKKVGLLKHERIHERTVGDKGAEIIVPLSEEIGKNLNKATVTSIGSDATKYNINLNDSVLYDHFSVFYDHATTVITNIENVIGKYVEDDIIPVGNYVKVNLTDIQLKPVIEGIILLEDSIEKNVYEIETIGTGIDDFEFPVKIGDKVLIGGNATDDITITLRGEKMLFVYVPNIVAFYTG
jgi:hypothetical protein